MNVKEIVEKHIKDNGYDGLVSSEYECGCILGNLMPCGEYYSDCKCAYKHEGKDGDWSMGTKKPE